MFEVSEIDGCRDCGKVPKWGCETQKNWAVFEGDFLSDELFGCTKITIANEQGGEASG